MKKIDLTGQRFGKLTVLGLIKPLNKNNRCLYWKCKCECGNEKNIQGGHLRSGHTNSCGCSWYEFGKQRKSWKGHGEIPSTYFTRLLSGAKKRKHPFNITIEYLWKLFLKQERKCALSGLPLDFTYGRNHHHKGTASVDRIDSTKGYIENNVQWVHKDINWMKQDYSNEYFLKLCNIINEYKKYENFK